MSFSRYSRYKDSGVHWLGVVPEHWTLQKLKSIASFSGGGTPARDNLSYWNGNIPWVSPKDMKTDRIVGAEESITEEGLRNSASSLLPAGRILLVVRSGILKHTIPVAINETPVALNQDMKALTINETLCVGSFFLRFVQGHNDQLLQAWAKQGATVESIEHSYLAETDIPLPSITEQRSIVAFLERETAKIDALVVEQRNLIELLKEKRQADISHAVTKGLNPDAPMKPSGIEWLGDIPSHWKVAPLRRFDCLVQTGPFGSQLHAEEYVAGAIPVINPVNIVNSRIIPSGEVTVSSTVVERLAHQKLIDGDILFSRRGELGRCALVTSEEQGWLCGTGCMIVRLNHVEYRAEYLSRFLSLGILRQYFESFSVGTIMDNLSASTLLSMPMLVPPAKEQEDIASVLRRESARLDALVGEGERAIALLEERRTALISAAVTGQIDVRELAEPVAA